MVKNLLTALNFNKHDEQHLASELKIWNWEIQLKSVCNSVPKYYASH